MFRSKSHNRMILHKLMRKGRRKNLPLNMRYYVLYAFLYKYMSDKLKNHLMYYLSGDEADLNMHPHSLTSSSQTSMWMIFSVRIFSKTLKTT